MFLMMFAVVKVFDDLGNDEPLNVRGTGEKLPEHEPLVRKAETREVFPELFLIRLRQAAEDLTRMAVVTRPSPGDSLTLALGYWRHRVRHLKCKTCCDITASDP